MINIYLTDFEYVNHVVRRITYIELLFYCFFNSVELLFKSYLYNILHYKK